MKLLLFFNPVESTNSIVVTYTGGDLCIPASAYVRGADISGTYTLVDNTATGTSRVWRKQNVVTYEDDWETPSEASDSLYVYYTSNNVWALGTTYTGQMKYIIGTTDALTSPTLESGWNYNKFNSEDTATYSMSIADNSSASSNGGITSYEIVSDDFISPVANLGSSYTTINFTVAPDDFFANYDQYKLNNGALERISSPLVYRVTSIESNTAAVINKINKLPWASVRLNKIRSFGSL